MMVQYRPVDCENKKPIRFDPGYISDIIYQVCVCVLLVVWWEGCDG